MTSSSLFDSEPDLPMSRLQLPELDSKGISLQLLRIDQTHPFISGNKWYKLKYNLKYAVENGYKSVLSFGGAYSNHIHALAWAAKEAGLVSVGVIRGEPEYVTNPTLSDANQWGMQLKFVTRKEYRLRNQTEFLSSLTETLPEELKPVLVIPEGGSNARAVEGCMEILSEAVIQATSPDLVILPCGTGGTLAGVALSQPDVKVLGIPVLKKADFLYDDIRNLMKSSGNKDPENWQLDLDGHYGGYGKCSAELLGFMEYIKVQSGVELDQIYTAKMLMRTLQLIEDGSIPAGSDLLMLHTGGLQGRRSVYA